MKCTYETLCVYIRNNMPLSYLCMHHHQRDCYYPKAIHSQELLVCTAIFLQDVRPILYMCDLIIYGTNREMAIPFLKIHIKDFLPQLVRNERAL